MSKLDEYTGHFDLGPVGFLSVIHRDDKLFGLLTGAPELPLYVSGPDAFRLVPVKAELEIGYTFLRDDTGRIDRIEMTQAARDFQHIGAKLHVNAKPLEGEVAPLNGHWHGSVGFPKKIGIDLHLFANESGALDGYLAIPAQRAYYLPIDRIDHEGKALEVKTKPPVDASFEGKIKRKDDTITAIKGQWTLRGKKSKIEFKSA